MLYLINGMEIIIDNINKNFWNFHSKKKYIIIFIIYKINFIIFL